MKTKTAALLGMASFVIACSGTISEAQAQCTSSVPLRRGGLYVAAGGGGLGALISAINTFNTAYMTQGGAFVANPPAKKEETGGGIWTRVIGGRVDTNFNVSGLANSSCGVHETYAGFQVGADVAKLNWGNSDTYVHVGVTAGYGQANFNEKSGTGSGNIDAPFVGAYATYANGNFFADVMARYNMFTTTQTEPASYGLFGQRLDARGYSLQGSAGYRINIPDSNWFVEPSGSIIYSNTSVDPLHFAGTHIFGGVTDTLPGILSINNLESTLGRLGLRAGTSFEAGNIVLQPFVAASIWHDFQGSYSATMNAFSPGPVVSSQITVSNVTTYGQYSIGIAGQSVDGWVGYIRLDYRKGADIDGLGVNGGIRYQFMPGDPVAAKGIFKAPVAPAVPLYNWAGFYVGGFTGASWGTNNWNMISGPSDVAPASNVISGSTSPKNAGVLAGGQFGYNFRAGDWVFGPEADIAWTNQKGSAACPTSLNNQPTTSSLCRSFPVSFFQCNNDHANPVFTLTGRVGHSFDRVMVYAKGGAAWTRDGYSITFNSPPAVPVRLSANFLTRSASDDRFGWTVGAGFEFGITPRWSTKVEYDYLDFGTKTLVFADPLVPVTASVKQSFSQVKIGLNYRLGDIH